MLRHFALATALIALPALAHANEWTVDPAHSTASFTVKHMMVSTVRGEFGKITGTASWSKPDYSDAKVDVTVDATTIDTREPKRDAHLRSADFFDVAKFPTLTFKSKRVEKAKETGHLTLVGDLTIHGVTKEVAFDVAGPSPEMKTPFGTRRRRRRGQGAHQPQGLRAQLEQGARSGRRARLRERRHRHQPRAVAEADAEEREGGALTSAER